LAVILDDAETIYPDIMNPKFASSGQTVPKSHREIGDRDILKELG
jgi:hypothetical protein